jgi:hypothetical protein
MVTPIISYLLGIALGTGYMTSLRFWGPIGFSEIVFAFVLGWLLIRWPYAILRVSTGIWGWTKIYLLFAVVIVFPLVTLVMYVWGEYAEIMTPEYVVSFVAGVLMMFSLAGAIANGVIDMRIVSTVFFAIFVAGNFVSLVLLDGNQGVRYSGFAKNPNQLLFYLASLFLLLAIYRPKMLLMSSPVLLYIGVISGSDAFILAMIAAVFIYILLKCCYSSQLSIAANIVLLLILCGISLFFAFLVYLDINVLSDVWMRADEGGVRLNLLENAIAATIHSPIVGLGAGSFSGVSAPFEGEEAHNNILDLSMQFGFILPVVLYAVIVAAMVRALRKKQFLIVALLIGFMISGFFHFSARHFVFWVELGVLYYYVLYAGRHENA